MLMSTISPLLKVGLSWIGMWPDASHGTFCWLFYITTLVVMQYFQYSYVYAHLDFNNFIKLIDGLGVTLEYTVIFFKLLYLWFNRRIFVNILRLMDNDWKEEEATELHKCVMIGKANLAHRCSKVMMLINALTTILYFIDNCIERCIVSENGQFREFPMQIQIPFEVYDSPIFEIIIVGLLVHVLETASVIAMLNSLILTLVLHVSGQIDIMCQELKELSTTCKPVSLITKSLIERHQKIILLSNNIEDYFSFVGLLQFVWNILVICCIGLMFIITLDMNIGSKSGILMKFIIPYLAVTIEAFIFCFAGEYLNTKSKSIGDAAYEAIWYDLSISECRMLLLIIIRSQKRLTITAGKFMDVTLESFATIMKASASYISVLHAIY